MEHSKIIDTLETYQDLQEHRGEHGIENQRERISHLATSYGPVGLR